IVLGHPLAVAERRLPGVASARVDAVDAHVPDTIRRIPRPRVPVHPLGVCEEDVNSRLPGSSSPPLALPKDFPMYGLTHRFATDSLADVTSIGASATVLVLDPVPLTLELARRSIADHSRFIVAENGTEALAMIDEHHPDIVMIDM